MPRSVDFCSLIKLCPTIYRVPLLQILCQITANNPSRTRQVDAPRTIRSLTTKVNGKLRRTQIGPRYGRIRRILFCLEYLSSAASVPKASLWLRRTDAAKARGVKWFRDAGYCGRNVRQGSQQSLQEAVARTEVVHNLGKMFIQRYTLPIWVIRSARGHRC
jgi:hypothetical protein